MNFTKNFVLPALCLAFAFAAGAQTKTDKMIIHRSDGGESKEIAISADTKITFADGKMKITQAAADAFEIAFSDVEKIKFDLQTSSADEIEAPLGDNVVISVSGSQVVIAAADRSAAVNYGVYSIGGQTVTAGVTDSEAVIDFGGLPRGIYIIRANAKIIKFVNK